MLNRKKILALPLVVLATVALILFVHTHSKKVVCNDEGSSSTSVYKSNDFSIVNILSLKFR